MTPRASQLTLLQPGSPQHKLERSKVCSSVCWLPEAQSSGAGVRWLPLPGCGEASTLSPDAALRVGGRTDGATVQEPLSPAASLGDSS